MGAFPAHRFGLEQPWSVWDMRYVMLFKNWNANGCFKHLLFPAAVWELVWHAEDEMLAKPSFLSSNQSRTLCSVFNFVSLYWKLWIYSHYVYRTHTAQQWNNHRLYTQWYKIYIFLINSDASRFFFFNKKRALCRRSFSSHSITVL